MGYFDPLPIFRNFVEVELEEAIISTDTVIRVTDIEKFPPVILRKDFLPCVIRDAARTVREVIYVTGIDVENHELTVERAREGSEACDWPVGTTFVYHTFTADTVQRLRAGGFAPVLDSNGVRPAIKRLSNSSVQLTGEFAEIETGIAVRLMRRGGGYVVPSDGEIGIFASERTIANGKTTLEIINGVVPSDIVGIDIGIYKAAIPGTLGDNIYVTAAGSMTARTLNDRFGDSLNVKDFGARGDGETDDSFALRKALEDAAGKTLYVPKGTYLCVENSLKIYSNTKLIADKGTVIRRCFNTSAQGTSVLLQAAPLPGENTIHDIVIQDVILDGNGANYGEVSFDLTFFGRPTAEGIEPRPIVNLVIEGCDFLDVVNFHAIDLNVCDNVLIRRCRFMGFKLDSSAANYDSMSYQREAIQFDIGSVNDDSIRDKNVVIEQCYFGPSSTPGFGSWRSAIGNHGWGESGPTTYFDAVVIRNNFFDLPDSTYYAVHLYVFTNVLVEGNRSRQCKFAYIENRYALAVPGSIYTSSEICIQNNVMDGLKTGGIYSGEGIRIETFKASTTPWDTETYASAASQNIIIRGNVMRYYTKAVNSRVAGVKGLICSENILEHCGDNVSYGNSFYLLPVITEAKIINNICRNCGTIYVQIPESITPEIDPESEGEDYDITTSYDWTSGLTISGNSFVDPSGATRVLYLGGKMRGFIFKDNVIDDHSDERTAAFGYVYIGADVLGGVVRDNYIFTKSEMTAFYAIGAGGASIVKDNNQNFINNEFYSNVGGSYA